MNDVSASPEAASSLPAGPRTDGAQGAAIVPSLLSIAKSTRAFFAVHLAQIGLHPGQDQLLDQLEPGVPISVSTLAERLAVRPSTVSKMLDRLIEKDFVQRAPNSEDARRTMVMLTPTGVGAKARVRDVWARLEEQLEGALAPGERDRVADALRTTDLILATKLRRLR